jgi:small membrane protein
MLSSIFILLFMALVLAVDYAAFGGRARRLLLLETIVFCVGGVFVVFPELASVLARLVGIGRGVDFILYPLVIWLVREMFVSRHRQWMEAERLAELVRALAMRSSTVVGTAGTVGSVRESS